VREKESVCKCVRVYANKEWFVGSALQLERERER